MSAEAAAVPGDPATAVVLDTNIVLDVFVFADTAAQPVREGLASGRLAWRATAPMREELARVLDYPHLVRRLTHYGLAAQDVLALFDRHATVVEVPDKAPYTCKDPDDQKFIDLAAAHRAVLLSKDQAVLYMRRRLLGLGARTASTLTQALALS